MSDWHPVSDEQLALVRSCGPDERCLVYGDEWIKLPVARIEAIMAHAFRAAYTAAAEALGEPVEAFDVGEMELGQTYMRVTVTGASGRTSHGDGKIPDPRAH